MADENPVSILFVGDDDVGKSTFLSRLTLGAASPANIPLPLLRPTDEPILLELRTRRPTAPLRLELSTFTSTTHTPDHPLRPSLIILCYSIPSRPSLHSLQTHWKPWVTTSLNHDEGLPVMLLGLKRDLRGEGVEGVVFPQEGLRVAQEMRCDRYAECSAVTGELCAEVWEDLCGMAVGMREGSGGGRAEGAYCGVM